MFCNGRIQVPVKDTKASDCTQLNIKISNNIRGKEGRGQKKKGGIGQEE